MDDAEVARLLASSLSRVRRSVAHPIATFVVRVVGRRVEIASRPDQHKHQSVNRRCVVGHESVDAEPSVASVGVARESRRVARRAHALLILVDLEPI